MDAIVAVFVGALEKVADAVGAAMSALVEKVKQIINDLLSPLFEQIEQLMITAFSGLVYAISDVFKACEVAYDSDSTGDNTINQETEPEELDGSVEVALGKFCRETSVLQSFLQVAFLLTIAIQIGFFIGVALTGGLGGILIPIIMTLITTLLVAVFQEALTSFASNILNYFVSIADNMNFALASWSIALIGLVLSYLALGSQISSQKIVEPTVIDTGTIHGKVEIITPRDAPDMDTSTNSGSTTSIAFGLMSLFVASLSLTTQFGEELHPAYKLGLDVAACYLSFRSLIEIIRSPSSTPGIRELTWGITMASIGVSQATLWGHLYELTY